MLPGSLPPASHSVSRAPAAPRALSGCWGRVRKREVPEMV